MSNNQQILFNQPPGNVGTIYPYTSGDITVTAYGFEIGTPNQPTDMYGKDDGPKESGLGINSDPNQEINNQTFISLDLSDLISQDCDKIPKITISSIEKDEEFSIYGTNTLGDIGFLLITTTQDTLEIPMFKTYKYISITASEDSNVLLASIDYILCDCKPEPCVPTKFDMTLEILPVVTLCISKPTVKVKNNAICICKPCKPKPPQDNHSDNDSDDDN